MRKETNKMQTENNKFEDGVLRADACMERHLGSRDSEYRTNQEDISNSFFGVGAEREEKRLIGDVYILMAKGLKPTGSESLESFVARNRETLEEGGEW